MKIAICSIGKNENQYYDEWLKHYINLGIKHFILYDNESITPISETIGRYEGVDIEVIPYKTDLLVSSTQCKAYLECCKKYQNFDYIGFFDMDEYVELNEGYKTIEDVLIECGNVSGVVAYWRMYYSFPPFLTQQPFEAYTKYRENPHVKSFVDPKKVKVWYDPHLPIVQGQIVDENGLKITSPVNHNGFTDKKIWIKHIWTRSLEEWKIKVARGNPDKTGNRRLEEFYEFNKE